MAKKPRTWAFSPKSLPKPAVPAAFKAEVQDKATVLVEEFLKPRCIKPPPKNWRWNYIIDIHSKWHRSFFYFIARYRSRGPTAIKPTFEAPFARLEYVGNRRFNLSYMRHTDKWWEVYQGLTLDRCLKTIRENQVFQPGGCVCLSKELSWSASNVQPVAHPVLFDMPPLEHIEHQIVEGMESTRPSSMPTRRRGGWSPRKTSTCYQTRPCSQSGSGCQEQGPDRERAETQAP